eukprot:1136649-Prorocentrum_minimum.AAC.2
MRGHLALPSDPGGAPHLVALPPHGLVRALPAGVRRASECQLAAAHARGVRFGGFRQRLHQNAAPRRFE